MNEKVIIVGYSGHAYVVIDAIFSSKGSVKGYCDTKAKNLNPYDIAYLGRESVNLLRSNAWFVGVGDNILRKKIIEKYINIGKLVSVIHHTSVIGAKCIVGKGSLLAANSVINPLGNIGIGCIINTGAIVEHECTIGSYSHIAPGAVLAGNVSVGNMCFVGANCVVKQGITIGNNVTIGAGSVVLQDVIDNQIIIGNPGKSYTKKNN